MPAILRHSLVIHTALFLAVAMPAACPVHAADAAFDHEDWQLVCDNTRTCRAAGYQSDAADMPVSVLLTRKAGAGTAVAGRVMLGDGWVQQIQNTTEFIVPQSAVAEYPAITPSLALGGPAATGPVTARHSRPRSVRELPETLSSGTLDASWRFGCRKRLKRLAGSQ